MQFITQTSGYLFLAVFGVSMILITYIFARWRRWNSKDGFLVAGRKVNWFLGGTSIAASWLWAPALFVSVQMAYQEGLAGIFWFTAPNILAIGLFAILGPRIRRMFPEGYTLPQFIRRRLGSNIHKAYLVPYFYYQVMAVTVQIFAGGSLVSLLTGIHLIIVMPILAAIALAYTLISGLEASIITDFVQIGLIVLISALIIPLTLHGGSDMITGNLVGLSVSGTYPSIMDYAKDIFDPGVAFSFGIITSIGLIAGAVSDQQYWQRTFAIKKRQLKKAFVFGALLFGLIPLTLSSLGFFAAASGITVPEGVDVSMIGVQTVATVLPGWAVFLFVVMLLAGLSSTLDSGLSAASSLWVTDVIEKKSQSETVRSARYAMFGITAFGLLLAICVNYIPGFGLMHLWWVMNTIAACVLVPTILSLYWRRLSAKGVFIGVLTAFIVGIPCFIYGNIINSTAITVASAVGIIMISTISCILFPKPLRTAQTI
ncbi:hypothetical protein KY362_02110 [Candidatus Woesearchaeota archaeon]|nr:hypothetical protein [Candidatus Woesearchaeota archaeon]